LRGDQEQQGAVFSYVQLEERVPSDHPLRKVRALVDGVLRGLDSQFSELYSTTGRPSIPPERLLRALLLQYLYGVRSERLLMEQLDYNLLFRWFVGLGVDDRVWDATTFTKNRERLLNGDLAVQFLESVVAAARAEGLTSDEHFSVDGTLIQAWAGQKSFKRKGGDGESGPGGGGRNPEVDFRGERRRSDTHASTTDPDARLYRKGKGQESKLSYLGHVVIENRNGLVVGAEVTLATGRAERESALSLLEEVPRAQRATVAGDRGYDVSSFVAALRDQGLTPHVAQKVKGSAIDARTTRHEGYRMSQVVRKIVEHPFGWLKAAAGLRQTKHRGRGRVSWSFTFAMAAYNLVRMAKLVENPA
jgi:transposase